MAEETTIEEKQEYLRQNILEKGYDANLFADYLITKKGEDGADIGAWSMEDLRKVVEEFTEKQTSFLSGGDNITSQVPNSNEITEETNQEKEIKKEENENGNESENQQKNCQI